MRRIKIKNFGPIKAGLREDDGFMDIKKVTVFIGNQGSGKSSIAKLASTLSWLEKALVRGDFREKDLTMYNRFKNKHCAYQNIHNYFKDNTEIEYRGTAYSFSYREGNFFVEKNPVNGYMVPKIMYIPAERNFVSAVDKPDKLKNLPSPLVTFLDEYENAKQDLKDSLVLPINNVKFEYQRLNSISWIVGDNYKIRLTEASSGFQSFVPLFLVTRYLALSLNKENDASRKELSVEEEKRIKQEIEKIYKNENLSDDVKRAALEVLSSRFKSSCFLNVVEEPEQNLFPSSQREILNKLTEYANQSEANGLILTTHSPYIINYLTLAVKGSQILEKINNSSINADELRDRLQAIVPLASCINFDSTAVYEIASDGIVNKLSSYDGIPSDENYLNAFLAETNQLFDNLLEIEEDL